MWLSTFKHKYTINHQMPVSDISTVPLLTTATVGELSLCIRTAGSQFVPATPPTRLTASGILLLIMWKGNRGRTQSPILLLRRWWSPSVKLVTPPERLAMSWTTQITFTGGPLLHCHLIPQSWRVHHLSKYSNKSNQRGSSKCFPYLIKLKKH